MKTHLRVLGTERRPICGSDIPTVDWLVYNIVDNRVENLDGTISTANARCTDCKLRAESGRRRYERISKKQLAEFPKEQEQKRSYARPRFFKDLDETCERSSLNK